VWRHNTVPGGGIDCNQHLNKKFADKASGKDVKRHQLEAMQSFVRERQRDGIAIAKQEGKYSGRKPSLTPARGRIAAAFISRFLTGPFKNKRPGRRACRILLRRKSRMLLGRTCGSN
jgi:hypothetical protein